MDGDPVEGEPSEEQKTLAELFDDAFPYYLAMGMSYEEYWRDNPSLVRAYRKAWEIKKRNDEFNRWRQGMYFYDALLRVSPVLRAFGKGEVKPEKYPDMPYPLTEKEAREQEELRERENFFKLKERLEAESERNRKARLEKEKKQEVTKNGDN